MRYVVDTAVLVSYDGADSHEGPSVTANAKESEMRISTAQRTDT